MMTLTFIAPDGSFTATCQSDTSALDELYPYGVMTIGDKVDPSAAALRVGRWQSFDGTVSWAVPSTAASQSRKASIEGECTVWCFRDEDIRQAFFDIAGGNICVLLRQATDL